MALADELDRTIRTAQERVEELEFQLQALRRDLARERQIRADALRLYTSSTGRQHPLGESSPEDVRDRPRAEKVLAALEAAQGPVTLSDLVAAMPDGPERGAVSAVVHRAIAKGEVRRLKRGVYELADSYPRAG